MMAVDRGGGQREGTEVRGQRTEVKDRVRGQEGQGMGRRQRVRRQGVRRAEDTRQRVLSRL
jgi:hypothetical protein